MRLPKLILDFLRPISKLTYHAFKRSKFWSNFIRKHFVVYKKSCELHQYWRRPWGCNLPQYYLEGKIRSQFLVEIIKKYAKPNAGILEIGCNVGRNLNYLFLAGFKKLEGIEISENAVHLLKKFYPEMARNAIIHNAPVERIIKNFRDNEFDVVFTMAVFEHIHTDSEWIFPEVARITKDILITIEDEIGFLSWKHFPRNYKKVFETLGMKQIEEFNCSAIDGLGSNFFARIFKKV